MQYEITIERLRPARKSMPARWTVHATARFTDLEALRAWAEKQGAPLHPTPGWAVRMACLA
jgi:hypothetical protein